MMKKAYIAILAVLFAVALFGFKQVSADTVTIEGVLNASFGGSNPDVPTDISGTLGSRLSFDASLGVTPGFSFGYWVINDFVRPELAVDYEFMISSKFELDALFAPDGSHVVVFADSNGKVLAIQRVINGGNASDASISVPSRPGLSVATPKWKTLTNETSLDNITGNKVFFLQYTVSSSTTFTLSVTNGTGGGEKTYNQVVTVSANADSEGNIFSHWEEDGFVVSTQRDFSFTMLSNRSLTAVFVASGPEANSPRVTLRDDLVIRSGFHSYVGQYYIPSGYELVEFGLITSTDSAVITHASANTTVHQGSKSIVETNEYLMSLAIGSHQSARAYLVVTDGTAVSTIYSENNVKFIDIAEYETGFENATKGSYASGSVSVDGVSWTLNDALIGTLADDRKDGLKSVRISAAGFIQSDTTFTNIIGLTFKVARYGTDAAATVTVEISKDGTNWINVTDAVTPNPIEVSLTTLQQVDILFADSANYLASGYLLSDNIYIKISKSGGNRVNLDTLSINTIFDGTTHTVTFNNDGSTSTSAVMDGSTVTQPSNPTKTGYSFAAWYSNSEFTGDAYVFSTAVTSSFTLYAKFNINQYTISFNSNGGSAVTSITQDYNTAVTQPSDPTKTGYTFSGWYSDAGLTSAYTFGTMPAANTTLYAKWTVTDLGKTMEDAAAITLPSQILEATTLTLPSSGSNGSSIAWTSSNNSIINASTGEVVLPVETTIVTLTATVTLNDQTTVREIEISVEPSDAVVSQLLYSYNFLDGGDSSNNAYANTNISTNVSYAADNPGGTTGTTAWLASYANLSLTTGTRLGGKLTSIESGANNSSANLRPNFTFSSEVTQIDILGVTTFGTAGNVGNIYLQTSTDGTTWTTISTKTFSSTISFSGISIASGTYIRILVAITASGTNSGIQFTKIQITGYPS